MKSIIVIALMTILIAACGGGSRAGETTNNADSSPVPEDTDTLSFAFAKQSDYDPEDPFGQMTDDNPPPDFAGIPKPAEEGSTHDIPGDIFSFEFDVPEEVKKEKIVFHPLVDDPALQDHAGKSFIMITAKNVRLYSKPDLKSNVIAEPELGDILVHIEDQQLPAKYTDLPEEIVKELEEQYDWYDDLQSEYEKIPGIPMEGYYNYWIKVTDGKDTGWVFRAYTFTSGYETLKILRELYRRGESFSSYQDYTVKTSFATYSGPFDQSDDFGKVGRFGIGDVKKVHMSELRKETIRTEYISFETVFPYEYTLSMKKPDDMISLYMDDTENRLNPVFITTDLFIHTLHLIFDRALKDVEIKQLYPFVKHLTQKMIDALSALKETKTDPGLAAAIDRLLCYFSVALQLFDEKNTETGVALSIEMARIRDMEIDRITKASGFSVSPLFGFTEDYSQFKPRGHYTVSPYLEKYFKVMMWYGLMKFNLEDVLTNNEETIAGLEPTRMAVLISILIKRDRELLDAYRFYEEALGFLIGKSVDASPLTYIAILDKIAPDWDVADLADDRKVNRFRQEASKLIPDPVIRGSLVAINQGEEFSSDKIYRAPKVFHLFSQKVTLDAQFLTILSNPSVRFRHFIDSLDIPASLGSELAEKQVETEKKKYPGYNEKLQETKAISLKLDRETWHGNFYQSYLSSINSFLRFPRNTGIPWFDHEKYTWKNMNSFFGAYTELKHDTILYAMQAYGAAEMGGGSLRYSYVTERLPHARGYIEPNQVFFKNLLTLNNILVRNAGGRLLYSSNMKQAFSYFFETIDSCYEIVDKEARFRDISEREYEYIFSLPSQMADLVLPAGVSASYDETDAGKNDFKMALVADIYTNANDEKVLICGSGIPKRIYISIFDSSGGRRICRGYTYSYYEFWNPLNERMNDDEWKKMVYGKDPSWERDKIPSWVIKHLD